MKIQETRLGQNEYTCSLELIYKWSVDFVIHWSHAAVDEQTNMSFIENLLIT